MITPITLLATGAAFFALLLSEKALTPLVSALGTTPLMLAVFCGAAQNIVSKAAKCVGGRPLSPFPFGACRFSTCAARLP
jgi:ATP/ADP translocase